MGTTGISTSSGLTVFQAAGFDDKTKNGVIEEKSWKTLWRDEGYKRKADINADGKIVEAEAKFYLWYLSDAKLEIKQKYPFTKDDQNVLFGLFKQALKSASNANNCVYDQEIDTKDVSSKIAKAFEYNKEMLEVVCEMEDPSERFNILINIVAEMPKTGIDRNRLGILFKESLKAASEISNDPALAEIHAESCHRNSAFDDLASAMARLGLYEEALEANRKIEEPYLKSCSLGEIALTMAKSGLFQEALKVAREINNLKVAQNAFADIAVEMANAGLFKEALKVTTTIKDLWINWETLCYVTAKMHLARMSKKEIQKIIMGIGAGNRLSKEELDILIFDWHALHYYYNNYEVYRHMH